MDKYELAVELQRSRYFVQHVSGTSIHGGYTDTVHSLLENRRFFYHGGAPCFHATLIILRYQTEAGKPYFRIAVLSKNLTVDSDDQNVFILSGECGDVPTDNGQRLWAYLELCRKQCQDGKSQNADLGAYKSIQNMMFPEGTDIFFQGVDPKAQTLYGKRILTAFARL